MFSAVDGAGALSAAGVAVGAAELGALVFGAIGAVAVDREHDERGRHAANAPAASRIVVGRPAIKQARPDEPGGPL